MLWGGVWGLKVVFGWFCGASDWLLSVGCVVAIVLSWGNGCATFNPWGFAPCRNILNRNSSSAHVIRAACERQLIDAGSRRQLLAGVTVANHGRSPAMLDVGFRT